MVLVEGGGEIYRGVGGRREECCVWEWRVIRRERYN